MFGYFPIDLKRNKDESDNALVDLPVELTQSKEARQIYCEYLQTAAGTVTTNSADNTALVTPSPDAFANDFDQGVIDMPTPLLVSLHAEQSNEAQCANNSNQDAPSINSQSAKKGKKRPITLMTEEEIKLAQDFLHSHSSTEDNKAAKSPAAQSTNNSNQHTPAIQFQSTKRPRTFFTDEEIKYAKESWHWSIPTQNNQGKPTEVSIYNQVQMLTATLYCAKTNKDFEHVWGKQDKSKLELLKQPYHRADARLRQNVFIREVVGHVLSIENLDPKIIVYLFSNNPALKNLLSSTTKGHEMGNLLVPIRSYIEKNLLREDCTEAIIAVINSIDDLFFLRKIKEACAKYMLNLNTQLLVQQRHLYLIYNFTDKRIELLRPNSTDRVDVMRFAK